VTNVVAQLKGLLASAVGNEVDRTLTDLGLEDKRHALVKTLSGGMKRKLSVGIALVGGSKVSQSPLSAVTELIIEYCVMIRVTRLAVWCSGNALVSINAVALHRARLVLGWVTAFGQVNCLIT